MPDAYADPLPIVTGHAWALGLGVTAEILVAAEHWGARTPERHLLTSVDPSFPERVQPGDVLVGGDCFAAGIRDDTPVRAILNAGLGAVIAYSLDADFARIAREAGLRAIEMEESLAIHTGERLRVDLEGSRVVNLSSGDRYPIRGIGEDALVLLRARLSERTG